jgi:hypothetical protein
MGAVFGPPFSFGLCISEGTARRFGPLVQGGPKH